MTLSFVIGCGIDVPTPEDSARSKIREIIHFYGGHCLPCVFHTCFSNLNDLFIKQVWFYLSPFDPASSPHTWPGFGFQAHCMYTRIICASTSYL